MIIWSGTTKDDSELVEWMKPRYGGTHSDNVCVMHVSRTETTPGAQPTAGVYQPLLPDTKRRMRIDTLIPHHKGDRRYVLIFCERPAIEAAALNTMLEGRKK